MKKKNFFLEHKQFTIFFILALAIAGVAIFAEGPAGGCYDGFPEGSLQGISAGRR